jgi:serine/threonine-protein kinase
MLAPMGKSAGEARVGQTLGKYTLLRVIGEGGMAVVYEAVHRNGNRVALKLLRPEVSIGVDVRARFVREGYAANKVGHPGAVRILDDDERDGMAFLVMELLDGTTLDAFSRGFAESEHARRGRVPPALASGIAERVLDVLVAAHRAGVVHRDIKPENIFLERSGAVKVLDFGIARVSIPGETSSTVTGRMLGTPAFVSPEQAYGRRAEVDARSDVYAVGATLFTLLSGRLVHEAETPEETLILAATEPAPPLASLVDVDPRIADIVDRALQHRRDDRWPTALAMRDALREAHRAVFGSNVPDVLDFALVPSVARPALRTSEAPRRRGLGLALGVALALVGILGGTRTLLARGDAPTTTVKPASSLEASSANDEIARSPLDASSTAEPRGSTAQADAAPASRESPAPDVSHAASATSVAEAAKASARSAHPGAASASALPPSTSVRASGRTCGVDIDEEGRKWPRRCP